MTINAIFVVSMVGVSMLASQGLTQNRTHQVGFRLGDGDVVITVDNRPIASYVYRDPSGDIPRPYFAHVKAPSGFQVTRNHPPRTGQDRTDHATMHPGIWMAFGDLDAADFWRNRARIKHVRFIEKPTGGIDRGSFVEEKKYLRSDGSLVCDEEFRCEVRVRPGGYLLTWDSTFSSERAFYFGDQEEMGLGFRVASPLTELKGGRLSDSNGRQGAKAIWSQSAKWCDYSGVIDGQRVGMTLMCHPANVRPSWMHARNYGFVAANPFGRQAMKKGGQSKVVVKPGETLRLRYAVWIHSADADKESTIHSTYTEYIRNVDPPRRK
jgi:hypothetical protein